MARRLTQWAVLLIVLTFGVVAGYVALDRYLDPFDDQSFDSAVWAAAADQDEERRGPMARDAACHVPVGTTAERVRELLGEPSCAVDGNPPDKWGRRPKGFMRWTYWLGCWSGTGPYGFDSASLDIHFDRDGRVVEVEITGG